MSRLILLPENPGTSSGYHKAVKADLDKLMITENDTVIVYSSSYNISIPNAITINRPKKFALKRFINIFLLRVSTEVNISELLPFLRGKVFDEIFCGEVIFYRAIRKLFPHREIIVRLHNFYTLLKKRQKKLKYKLNFQFKLVLFLITKLETEISKDKNVRTIFITKEEYGYFKKLHPNAKSEYWPAYTPETSVFKPPSKPIIVWFGGVSTHKRFTIDYFIKHVFKKIRSEYLTVEFHLWGKGTQRYNDVSNLIFGHGFYKKEGFPLAGEALYINPDLLGGGIKLKVGDLLDNGIPFISTQYGVEGYQLPDTDHILIGNIDAWQNMIITYLRKNRLI